MIVCGTKYLFGPTYSSANGVLCVEEAWLYWNSPIAYSYAYVWKQFTGAKVCSVVYSLICNHYYHIVLSRNG